MFVYRIQRFARSDLIMISYYIPGLNDSPWYDAEQPMKRYNTIDWCKIEQGPPLDNDELERENHYKK